ncbi:hypothetical protein [Streptomyces mayteni]
MHLAYLLCEAGEAERKAANLWWTLQEIAGDDLTARYGREVEPPAELDQIGDLMLRLDNAEIRLANALDEHRDQAHCIALREEEFRRFVASPASISLDDFDKMNAAEFEQVTARLARRDGLTVR